MPPSAIVPPELLEELDPTFPSSETPLLAPLEFPLDAPPLLPPLPSGDPLFEVDPPHAAASATPIETAKITLVLFMASAPPRGQCADATPKDHP